MRPYESFGNVIVWWCVPRVWKKYVLGEMRHSDLITRISAESKAHYSGRVFSNSSDSIKLEYIFVFDCD